MNKTITISGQTIELPFTEEEYQKLLKHNLAHIYDDEFKYQIGQFRIGLAIGLHLAEKADSFTERQMIEFGAECIHHMKTKGMGGNSVSIGLSKQVFRERYSGDSSL